MRYCSLLCCGMLLFSARCLVPARASDDTGSPSSRPTTSTVPEAPGYVSGKVLEVGIPSSVDGMVQRVLFFSPPVQDPRPLVVVLHFWSGNYVSDDPLRAGVVEAGWNYLHPDFRGPNRCPDACLSEKVLADIDDAIQYALDRGNVDRNAIFVVGTSGGGYATLGAYLRTRHPVALFMAWVPISDLTAWYWQSRSRNNKYAEDILLCTAPTGVYDDAAARARSPLYWDIPDRPRGRLEIFAGIHDGYTGSVPVSHSVLFFNKLAAYFERPDARVPDADLIRLLSREVDPDPASGKMEGRAVIYQRNMPEASLTLFEGGHELLADYCLARMKEAAAGEKK